MKKNDSDLAKKLAGKASSEFQIVIVRLLNE